MQLFVFLSFQEQRGREERRRRGFSVALNIFLYCEKCSMFMCLHASQGGEMNNRGLVIGSIRRTCSFLFCWSHRRAHPLKSKQTRRLIRLWFSTPVSMFFLSGFHFPAPDGDASRRGEVRSAAPDGCRRFSSRLAEAFVALTGRWWERSSALSEWVRPFLLKKLRLMRGWTVAGQDVSTRSAAPGWRRPLLEAAAHVAFFVSRQVTLPTPGCVSPLYWWYTVHYNALNVCVCVNGLLFLYKSRFKLIF